MLLVMGLMSCMRSSADGKLSMLAQRPGLRKLRLCDLRPCDSFKTASAPKFVYEPMA